MIRFLILAHRYLGIAVGVLMVLWCLSGFVMMYVQYPSVTQSLSLRGLSPLTTNDCCDVTNIERLHLVDIYRFRLEMMAGNPVLRISASNRQYPIVDLLSGKLFDSVTEDYAREVADSFSRNLSIAGDISHVAIVDKDQWTVTNFYNRHRPLYQFSLNDGDGTQFYVSHNTGEVVQFSTANQRFWNWVGPITHWLYPTFLRQHNFLWAQIVIWLTIAGIFLTVFGLYIGFRQFFKRLGKPDVYRGWMLWHHYLGLIFGLLILTWVVSGLFSMNPWNIVDFSAGQKQRQDLQGLPLSVGDVNSFVRKLSHRKLAGDIVRLEGYTLRGKLFILAYRQDGSYQRYDEDLEEKPIDQNEWQRIVNVIAPATQIESAQLISEGDAYYYSHHNPREFPVQRIVLNNEDQTRFYINAISGELISVYDRQQRTYRWIFNGLHRGDFTALVRSRPVWDILMWILLVGVSLGSLTGTYLGLRRLFKTNN